MRDYFSVIVYESEYLLWPRFEHPSYSQIGRILKSGSQEIVCTFFIFVERNQFCNILIFSKFELISFNVITYSRKVVFYTLILFFFLLIYKFVSFTLLNVRKIRFLYSCYVFSITKMSFMYIIVSWLISFLRM